jgi:hypothetical protein
MLTSVIVRSDTNIIEVLNPRVSGTFSWMTLTKFFQCIELTKCTLQSDSQKLSGDDITTKSRQCRLFVTNPSSGTRSFCHTYDAIFLRSSDLASKPTRIESGILVALLDGTGCDYYWLGKSNPASR